MVNASKERKLKMLDTIGTKIVEINATLHEKLSYFEEHSRETLDEAAQQFARLGDSLNKTSESLADLLKKLNQEGLAEKAANGFAPLIEASATFQESLVEV